MTSPEAPSQSPGPTPSAVGLAIHVFDDPAGTFTKLAARPMVWLPIVLLIVVTAVSQFMMPANLLREQTARTLARVEQQTGKPLDASMRADRLAKVGSTSSRLIGTATGSVFLLIWLVIVAAVCKLIFGAGAPEPIRFRQEFSMAAHANLVLLLGMIVTVFLIRASGRLDTTVSLGFLAPSGFAHAYLSRLSIWGAWVVVLLAIGNKVLAKGKSLTGPLLILGGLWLVVNVPLAFLTKMAMGQ